MRSDQITISYSSIDEIKSFDGLISTLFTQVAERVAILHAAFNNAFADSKNDHPSQLMYQGLWLKIQTLFAEHVDPSKPLKELTAKFDELANQLVAIVEHYFKEYKNEIAQKSALLKKMKISDIESYQFDAQKFYSDLSKEKKELFPVLIEAFKALAIQKYYLKRMMLDFQSNLLVGSQKDELITQYDKKIEEISEKLNSEFVCEAIQDEAEVSHEKQKKQLEFRAVLAAAADKEALSAIPVVREKIKRRKKSVATIVNSHFDQIKKTETGLFVQRCIQLQEDIKNYNLSYKKKQESIQKGEYTSAREFECVASNAESEYSRIVSEIEKLKKERGGFSKKKKKLLQKLAQEKHDLPGRNYEFRDEGSVANLSAEKIPALKFLTDKLHELDKVLIYLQINDEPPQLMDGLLFDANNIRVNIVGLLKKLNDDLMAASSSLSEKKGPESALYSNITNEVGGYARGVNNAASKLRNDLIELCNKQTLLNSLWKKDAVEAVKASLMAQNIQLVFNDESRLRQLIAKDILIQQPKNQEEIKQVQAKYANEIGYWVGRVVRIRALLSESEKQCRRLLSRIEQEELNKEVQNAKLKCMQSIDAYESTVKDVDVSALSAESLDGTADGLRALYHEYSKEEEEPIDTVPASNHVTSSLHGALLEKKDPGPSFLSSISFGSHFPPATENKTDRKIVMSQEEREKYQVASIPPRVIRDDDREKEEKREDKIIKISPSQSSPGVIKEKKETNFWQRHRKKIIIGGLIGLGLLVVGGVVTALIFAPEITLPALLGVGGSIVAEYGIAGTVGIAIGAISAAAGIGAGTGAAIGKIQDSCISLEKNDEEKQPLLQDSRIETNRKQPLLDEPSSPSLITRTLNQKQVSSVPVPIDIEARKKESHATASRNVEISSSQILSMPTGMSLYKGKAASNCSVRDFEKALAKNIFQMIWKNFTLSAQIQQKLLKEVDQNEDRAREVFEKNWAIMDRQEGIKKILTEMLNECSLTQSDFDDSFLKGYVAFYFQQRDNVVGIIRYTQNSI